MGLDNLLNAFLNSAQQHGTENKSYINKETWTTNETPEIKKGHKVALYKIFNKTVKTLNTEDSLTQEQINSLRESAKTIHERYTAATSKSFWQFRKYFSSSMAKAEQKEGLAYQALVNSLDAKEKELKDRVAAWGSPVQAFQNSKRTPVALAAPRALEVQGEGRNLPLDRLQTEKTQALALIAPKDSSQPAELTETNESLALALPNRNELV